MEPCETSVPTQDERTMATLAHVLQLVGWWIAPLIIFLLKRESRFVSFHALQALLLQIAHVCIAVVGMVLWVLVIFGAIMRHPQTSTGPPPTFLLIMPLFWLGWMGMWVLVLVVAIVYGIKAGRGEWAEYPLLGRLARKNC